MALVFASRSLLTSFRDDTLVKLWQFSISRLDDERQSIQGQGGSAVCLCSCNNIIIISKQARSPLLENLPASLQVLQHASSLASQRHKYLFSAPRVLYVMKCPVYVVRGINTELGYLPCFPDGASAVEGGGCGARLLRLVRRVHHAFSIFFVGHRSRQWHTIIVRYLERGKITIRIGIWICHVGFRLLCPETNLNSIKSRINDRGLISRDIESRKHINAT